MSKPEWALSMTGMVSHFDAGSIFVVFGQFWMASQ